MENEKYQAEITENFNEETVNKAIKFEGKDVRAFLDLFRPTVEQVKAERPFNYTYYIASTFQEWKELPAEARKITPLIKLKKN